MLAFRVRVNHGAPVVAGASDLGVLTAVVNAVGKLGADCRRHDDDGGPDIFLKLTGLTSRSSGKDEHLHWVDWHELAPGDSVVIEVIETDSPHAVIGGEAAQKRANDERAYYEHCKRDYFQMRDRSEPQE